MKINTIGLTFMAIHLRQGHYQTTKHMSSFTKEI